MTSDNLGNKIPFFTFSNGNFYHTDFIRVKQAADSMAAGIEKGTFSNFFDCHHDM